MDKKEILKTSKEYENSLKAMKPNIIRDKLLAEPYEDENIQKGINVVSLSYDYAQDPKYKELMTIESSLNGKIINRFNNIPQTKEELTTRLKMIRQATKVMILENGTISGTGTHSELIKKNLIYRRIFDPHTELPSMEGN